MRGPEVERSLSLFIRPDFPVLARLVSEVFHTLYAAARLPLLYELLCDIS